MQLNIQIRSIIIIDIFKTLVLSVVMYAGPPTEILKNEQRWSKEVTAPIYHILYGKIGPGRPLKFAKILLGSVAFVPMPPSAAVCMGCQ